MLLFYSLLAVGIICNFFPVSRSQRGRFGFREWDFEYVRIIVQPGAQVLPSSSENLPQSFISDFKDRGLWVHLSSRMCGKHLISKH